MGEIGKVVQYDDRVRACLILPVELRKGCRDIAFDDVLEEIDDARTVGKAEHAAHRFGLHAAATMGNRLVEQGKAVTGGTLCSAGDHRQRLRIGLETFLAGNGGEQADEIGGADAAQVEALAARQNGNWNLADFGGREDEFHMFRRLFQRLQKTVKRLRRQHVHFVDDIDLVARRNRAVTHLLDDLANIVDTRMGGGVHLDHVDMPAFHDRLAMFAGDPKVDGRLVDGVGLVIQRAGENACRGRFAHAANAGQHIGLGNAAGLKRVGQRADHRLLADHQIGKIFRAIFACQYPVAGPDLGFACCGGYGIAHCLASLFCQFVLGR
ncbi:hypothetical protein D3C87_616570 [compost metagenome]